VRSQAWIRVFSSTQSTSAPFGVQAEPDTIDHLPHQLRVVAELERADLAGEAPGSSEPTQTRY